VDLVIDVDPVTIDFRHCGFPILFRVIVRLAIALQHPSAIQSLLGNAETEHGICDANEIDTAATKTLPQRTTEISKLYSIRAIPN
jgi:hypothetical protein